MRYYEYLHVVGFEETNLVGNVYFANHIRWQGRVREMFLRDHCREILAELERGLALVTVHCSCDYLDESAAFDEVAIRMRLGDLTQTRITLLFEYWRRPDGPDREEVLVARGRAAGRLYAPPGRPGSTHSRTRAPARSPQRIRHLTQLYGPDSESLTSGREWWLDRCCRCRSPRRSTKDRPPPPR